MSGAQKAIKQKARYTNLVVDYLLQQLVDPQTTADPLATAAHLYVFKASFERSPMPRVASLCFERGLLSFLTSILQRDYHPKDKSNELVLYHLALEIIWRFSNMEREVAGAIVSEPLVKAITRFTDTSNHFYQFPPLFTQKLSNACRNTYFVQQRVSVLPCTPETWDDIVFYNPAMAQCDAVTHVHHCSLTVQPAGSDQAFSIAKLLISEGLAWTKFQASATRKPPVGRSIAELVGEVYNPSSQQQSLLAEVDGEGEGHYEEEDVIVLDTVGGPYFWAYVGAGSVSMVDSVTDLLQKELPSMTTFTPTVGNLVAVRDEEPSPGLPGMMRAKVLVVKRVEVTVFAVDFGVMRTVKVNSVFPLSGSALCLVHLDGLAKLCCLAGVQAPPADQDVVELALCTLTNLCKHFVNPGFTFAEAGGVKNLLTLLHLVPPGLRLQVIRLVCNITSISRISKAHDWTPFIRPLLDVAVQMKGADDSNSRNLLTACLLSLTNMLYRKSQYHEHFFEQQGHIIGLNMMRIFKSTIPILRAAAGMMRAAYPGLMRLIPGDTDSARLSVDTQSGYFDEKEEEDTGSVSLPRGKVEDRESPSDEEPTAAMKRVMPQQLSEEREQEHKADSGDGTESVSDSVSSSFDLRAGEKTGVSELSSQRQREQSPDTCEMVPVDGSHPYSSVDLDHNYVVGSYKAIQNDTTHHILDVQDVNGISVWNLCEIICGMLNSQGGTVYMGLTHQGSVRGFRLSRDDRDSIRLGVDNVMTRLTPIVPHTQLNISYASVMQPDGQVITDVYIVEMQVRSPDEPVFYTFGKIPKCYQRFGADNHILTEQDVREMVVKEEECKYVPYVQSLRQQIRQLQDQLGS